ncbi:MAG: oligosaccharide flippase family protein [Candidatus Omnitrophota bacterium]
MSFIGKNISANIFSNVWSAVLMLFLTPLYVKFLGVESYGLIGFYLSWLAMIGILDTGISATATREIAWFSARPGEREKIPVFLRSIEVVYWSIVLFLGMGILLGAWLFGVNWFQTKSLPPELIRNTLSLMAISLIIHVPSGLYNAGLMGLQKQVECSGFLALFGTIRGIGAAVVLWKINPDIRVFFLWQIFASILQTGVMRWLLWRKVRIDKAPARFSLEILKSVKGFAGGMILITALSILMTQADKLILSRMVSLKIFGFYMLAWTVSSGLSRVAIPLMQAFSPRFTELVSKGNDRELAKQVHLASQLMSVLIIPPAALIMVFSKQILYAWLGNPEIAAGAWQILGVMVAGTVLTSCSYPALSILYSRKKLGSVIVMNLFFLTALFPLLIVMIIHFGAIGAAFIWVLYGLVQYVVYQVYGLEGITKTRFFSFLLRDLIVPCVVSFAVAGLSGYLLSGVKEGIVFFILLGFGLFVGWSVSLLSCGDLLKVITEKISLKKKAVVTC